MGRLERRYLVYNPCCKKERIDTPHPLLDSVVGSTVWETGLNFQLSQSPCSRLKSQGKMYDSCIAEKAQDWRRGGLDPSLLG